MKTGSQNPRRIWRFSIWISNAFLWHFQNLFEFVSKCIIDRLSMTCNFRTDWLMNWVRTYLFKFTQLERGFINDIISRFDFAMDFCNFGSQKMVGTLIFWCQMTKSNALNIQFLMLYYSIWKCWIHIDFCSWGTGEG